MTLQNILVVDDDITVRLLARHHLEAAGFRVEEVAHGAEAVGAAERLAPAAILLDVRLPGRDGYDICAELRTKPGFQETPILMLTGLDDGASIERAYEAGATQFTTKPVNWMNEIHRLRFMIRAAQGRQELDRSRAELARVRDEWEMTFAAIDDIMLLLDERLHIRRANRAAGAACGLPESELVGRHYCAAFCQHAAPCADCPAVRALAARVPVAQERNSCTRDGRVRMITVWPVLGDGGGVHSLVLAGRDITEYKALEREYLHAQKMEAVGVLAAGVAHDFNNLLQAIGGFADLMAEEPGLSGALKEGVDEIRATARRGRELTRQLLAASRKVDSQKQRMAVAPAVRALESLLGRTLPRNVSIALQVREPLHDIEADAIQFDQILMNLAVNAGHAMPGGGRLLLAASNRELGEAYCQMHPGARPGPHVLIEVSDTGCGMSPDTLGRIFEPFFTTKAPGEGTGLGLSVVYNIVRNHGGHVTCYSELGRGTTFRVYLPALRTSPGVDSAASKGDPPRGRGQLILVVDDEPLLRRLGERLLRRHGYEVVTAENGARALDVFQLQRGRVALVLLDLNMPVMGGQDCLDHLLTLDPAVRVIVATGMVDTSYKKEILKGKVRDILLKPYEEDTLLRAVHHALEDAPTRPGTA